MSKKFNYFYRSFYYVLKRFGSVPLFIGGTARINYHENQTYEPAIKSLPGLVGNENDLAKGGHSLNSISRINRSIFTKTCFQI